MRIHKIIIIIVDATQNLVTKIISYFGLDKAKTLKKNS